MSFFRSTQEDEFSLAEAEAALQNLSEMRPEAQDSEYLMEETLSLDSKHSDRMLGILKDKSLDPSVSEIHLSETRAAKAQAWEMQAFEAQARTIQPKRSLTDMTVTSALKNKPSKEKEVISNKRSDAIFSRPLWSSKAEYIMAQLSYSMRPVHFWRFIFLCLHSGGCSFFIIYTTMLILVGIPLLFLELAVGQRMNQDSLDLWKIIGPWSGGVGYSAFLVCFVATTYVNVVNSWIFFYVSHSFQTHVPWQKCPLMKNSSDIFDPECSQTTPSTYFWYRQLLKVSNRIEDGGPPALSLSMPYFLSWFLVCAFMINGLKSTGKVLYILVPLSCFFMFCLLIRSLMLEGAKFGLQYLLKIKTSAMYSFTTWTIAGCQVLLDLGLGFGPVISLASHMPRSNNCLSDAFVLALGKMATLLVITPCLFSVLGFWVTSATHRCSERNVEALLNMIAQGDLPLEVKPPANIGKDPTSVYNTWLKDLPEPLKQLVLTKVPECSKHSHFLKIKEGTHFVIPTLVEVTSTIPGSTLWSLFLFLMMLTEGLSTTMGFVHGLITPLQDTFSLWKQSRLITVGISMIMFLCGLFYLRPSGSYFIRLLNVYCTIFPIIFILLCENIAVAWAYGAKRFIEELKILWGHPTSRIFVCLWRFVNPLALVAMLVAILMNLSTRPLFYVTWNSENSTQMLRLYPPWGLILVVFCLTILLCPIPVYFVYCLAYRIPFKSKSQIRSITSSKSLTQTDHKRSGSEVSREEVLQVIRQKSDQTSEFLTSFDLTT